MATLDLGVLVALGAVEVGVQLARGCRGHRDVQAVGVEASGQPPGALLSHTVRASKVARTRGHHEHVSGGQEARRPDTLTSSHVT